MQKNLISNLTEVPVAQQQFMKAAMAEAARRQAIRSSILFWEEVAPAFNSSAQEDCYRQMEEEARKAGEWGLVHRARHLQNKTRRLNKAVAA